MADERSGEAMEPQQLVGWGEFEGLGAKAATLKALALTLRFILKLAVGLVVAAGSFALMQIALTYSLPLVTDLSPGWSSEDLPLWAAIVSLLLELAAAIVGFYLVGKAMAGLSKTGRGKATTSSRKAGAS